MKNSGYMDRAMKASDPRYARILGKLGHVARSDMVTQEPDELAELRAEYQEIVGKRPFNGWDADTLRAKIAEAKE